MASAASLSKRLDFIESSMTQCAGVDRKRYLGSFEEFAKDMFKERMGSELIIAPHHKAMCRFVDDVVAGKIQRGIINVPPGYTKTEFLSIALIAYGIAINPKARFLHLSYSHALALQNSASARNTVCLEKYQDNFPRTIRDDAKAKEIWWTKQNGGVRATSSMGQVTGFRAGHMDHTPDNFTGALSIDDPVKPEDAYSEVMREGVNNNYNETISSRVAIETVPILVVMQRIHWNDLSGYLLRGGSGEKWHHLNMPVIVDNSIEYPAKYTHGIPYDHQLEDGWLWEFKHNSEHEEALKSHRRKWRAQYMQDPIERDEESQIWTEKVINKARARLFGDKTRTIVSVDPAVTNNATSDEHGIIIASKHQKDQYTIDADFTRKGSPSEWASAAMSAYDRYDADAIVIETNQGGDMCEQTLRAAGFNGKVIRVHAAKGKVARSEPIAALYELGQVSHGEGLSLLEDEMMDLDPLTGKAKGKSPNRVDALVWALTELSGGSAYNIDSW